MSNLSVAAPHLISHVPLTLAVFTAPQHASLQLVNKLTIGFILFLWPVWEAHHVFKLAEHRECGPPQAESVWFCTC